MQWPVLSRITIQKQEKFNSNHTRLLCGRQELVLRGHRGQGSELLKIPGKKDGNFRALLRYVLDNNDQALANRLNTAGANATYLSYHIQNEIIDAVEKQITVCIIIISQY